jgi:hypothetical protein
VETPTRRGELLNSISHKGALEEEALEEELHEEEEVPVGGVRPRPTLHQLLE